MRRPIDAPKVKDAAWVGETPTLLIGRFYTQDRWGYYETDDAPILDVIVNGTVTKGTVLGCGKTGNESLCRVMIEVDGGITEITLPCIIQGDAPLESLVPAPGKVKKQASNVDQVALVLKQLRERKKRVTEPTIGVLTPMTVASLQGTEPNATQKKFRGCLPQVAILLVAGIAATAAACNRIISDGIDTPSLHKKMEAPPLAIWSADGNVGSHERSMLFSKYGVQHAKDETRGEVLRFHRSKGLKEVAISGENLVFSVKTNENRTLLIQAGEYVIRVYENGDATFE